MSSSPQPEHQTSQPGNTINGHKIWRGICLSHVHGEELLNGLDDVEIRPDDILLLTYPKSGTHFIAGIIHDILTIYAKRKPEDKSLIPLELGQNLDRLNSAPRDVVRLILTHLPWDLIPASLRDGNHKIFHVMRNPKDILCSRFPFLKNRKVIDEDLSMDEYLDSFINDTCNYGDYFKWLKRWYPNRTNAQLLNCHFEDMKEDLLSTTRKVARHLGYDLTEEQLSSVAENNEFENIKKTTTGLGILFIRKGKSGSWKEELTEQQVSKLDKWIAEGRVGLDGVDFRF